MSLWVCNLLRESRNPVHKQSPDVAGNMKKQMPVFQPEDEDAAWNPDSWGWF